MKAQQFWLMFSSHSQHCEFRAFCRHSLVLNALLTEVRQKPKGDYMYPVGGLVKSQLKHPVGPRKAGSNYKASSASRTGRATFGQTKKWQILTLKIVGNGPASPSRPGCSSGLSGRTPNPLHNSVEQFLPKWSTACTYKIIFGRKLKRYSLRHCNKLIIYPSLMSNIAGIKCLRSMRLMQIPPWIHHILLLIASWSR